MNDTQEQVKQFKKCYLDYDCQSQLDIDDLLRAVVEECCDSFNETFLMNITNQSPVTQKMMLDAQIKMPFRWLLEDK